MVELLAVLPFKTPSFDREWAARVFDGVELACLELGHPNTEVTIDPRRGRIAIRQAGALVPLEARAYIYLPSSCERQHTLLAKIAQNRYADFVSREWDVVTQFLEEHLSRTGRWVNPPRSARRAANKLIQMQAAATQGLPMPPTVVTNTPQEATGVLPRGRGRGISKPIGESGNLAPDCMAPTSFFTRSEILADQASIRLAPGCFQSYIAAQVELRTYVFGRRAISLAVRPRNKAHTPDLSCQDLADSDFAVTTEFRKYEAELIALVKALGLRYAAIDSLVARGRCYFLEINPSGGWRWIPAALQPALDREFRRLVFP